MDLAKDLGNLPPNVCTPAYLADQARELAKRYRMKVTVLERADMERLGMHTLLSVAQGSAQPPKFITLEHRGGPAKTKPVALVGKGITFDTGGISLKPAGEMDEMKFDMCGAASVLGTHEGGGGDAAAGQRRSASSRPPRTCPAAAPPGPATSSRASRARPSRSSTPTPRAG